MLTSEQRQWLRELREQLLEAVLERIVELSAEEAPRSPSAERLALCDYASACVAAALKRIPDGGDEPIDLVTRRDSTPALFATPLLDLGLGDLSEALWEVEAEQLERLVFRYEDGGIEIRVFEYDEWVLASHLELKARTARRTGPRDLRSDIAGACKADRVDVGMINQVLADS